MKLMINMKKLLNTQEKGIDVRDKLSKKSTPIRWAIIYIFMLSIFIFGAYGPGYEPVDPIYADF